MFILLPVPERKGDWPFFTGALILLNVLVFLIVWPIEKRRAGVVSRDDWQASAERLTAIALAPESGLGESDRVILEAEKGVAPVSVRRLETFRRIHEQPITLSGASRHKWEEAYPRFEAMNRSIEAAHVGETPYRRFGFRPDKSWFPGILTHEFLHAGIWHLLFNMLFLWVIGTVLEPRCGIWMLGIYLVGGVAAALAQVFSGQLGADAMVGASGAVAALMGAGLFALPGAQIKLFYGLVMFVSGRAGTFHAPLWACLPLWLLQQLFMAGMTAGAEVVTVGYWAHIGGFVFGALLGLAIRYLMPTSSQSF